MALVRKPVSIYWVEALTLTISHQIEIIAGDSMKRSLWYLQHRRSPAQKIVHPGQLSSSMQPKDAILKVEGSIFMLKRR